MTTTAQPVQADIQTFIADNLGDREPLEVLAETHSALEHATRGLDKDTLRKPEKPGKWSVIEVVQHLADTELVLGFRYRKVLAEDSPRIPAFDQDAWAAGLRYRDARLSDALAQFHALREANLALLHAVRPDQWERYGLHEERGKETLAHMIRLEAAHDLYHLGQIERIKKAIGA